MTDDLKRLSDLTHSGEKLLEGLLRARGDAEIDAIIERVQRWSEELIALGEAIDPIRLRFRLVRPTLEETARIWPLYPELRDYQRGHCNYVEAALGRVNAYLRQPAARPKGKGGRRKYDDDTIVDKARAFWKSSDTGSKVEAAREAMARFPGLYEGSGKTLSIAKRIAKKM